MNNQQIHPNSMVCSSGDVWYTYDGESTLQLTINNIPSDLLVEHFRLQKRVKNLTELTPDLREVIINAYKKDIERLKAV